MRKFLAVFAAVAFGVVILGISLIQVRGVRPGQEQVAGLNPNSELSLYIDDPSYFAKVVGQRTKVLLTFDPNAKAEYLTSLAQERFQLAQVLIEEGRNKLGLWTWRKALIYQSRSLQLFRSMEDEQLLVQGRRLAIQIEAFSEKLEEQELVFLGDDLVELNLLKTMLTDNTQTLRSLIPQILE